MAPTNGYATVAHVQAHLNSLGGPGITIGAATKPNTGEVEGFLDQVAAEIDSVLKGRNYGTVPATGTNDVLLIRRYLSIKVASMVWYAGFMADEPPAKVRSWDKEYEAFIARLISGAQRLVDQSQESRRGVMYMSRYVED